MKKSSLKLCDISYIILITASATVLLLTVLFSFGIIDSVGGAVAWAALIISGIITLLSLIFRRPGGSLFKMLGFYLTHSGIVILLAGFSLFRLFGDSVSAYVPIGGETYYSSIQRESGDICELGFNFRADSFETENYPDGSPKQYYLTLSFIDEITLRSENVILSVNHPIRRNGYKIYLMSQSGGFANLVMRRDPGEFAVKLGIAVLIVGCITELIAGNSCTVSANRNKTQKEDGNER